MLTACTNCGAKIRVPDSAVGKKGKCPRCGASITITAPPPEAPTEESDSLPDPEGTTEHSVSESAPPPVPRGSRRRDDEEDESDRPSRRRRDDDDEDDDRRSRRRRDEGDLNVRRRRPQESMGLSIASMVCGITGSVVLIPLGCCCGLPGVVIGSIVSGILALIAIILGFMGMSRGGKGMAITGIVMGFVTFLLIIVMVVMMVVFGVAFFALHQAQQNQPPPPNFRFR